MKWGSMEPRIIKTDEQYRLYLAEIEKLAAGDPEVESVEGARLELLAKLVEDYEKTRYVFAKPDPIDAITFRMEQQGLRQKDIAELLGGKNRASEVLARKRPLTLPMIRALHQRLDIPPHLLIQEPRGEYQVEDAVDPDQVPADVLVKRGWIETTDAAKSFVQRLLAPAGSPVFLRQTLIARAGSKTNRTNIWLWLSRVREVAASRSYLKGRFKQEELNEQLLSYLVRLSWMDKGPRLAIEFLEERGIAVVIEPHLPGTRLDGAALIGRDGVPVIGLTLREDRLDNFWFTLLHECVHAWKHLNSRNHRAIADECIEKADTDEEDVEKEANDGAAEILLPKAVWRRSTAYLSPSPRNIYALAEKRQISPSIVAGRLRYERQDYSLFAKLVGHRQVRAQFPEVRWG
jgi:HTH-type transcriptional regulator/antitoxin HigA